jgi:hypothetical protein
VFQAIAAWWTASPDKAKLDGIQAGATANLSDGLLRARSSHTGTQAISTVSGLQEALNGKASLVAGLVPASQLPSYVDDVIEYSSLAAFAATGDAGKIYVARDTNRIYRWSGSTYIEISASPGSTDSVPEGASNKYFTELRASQAAPVQSVAGKTGAVLLTAVNVGAADAVHSHGLGDVTLPGGTTLTDGDGPAFLDQLCGNSYTDAVEAFANGIHAGNALTAITVSSILDQGDNPTPLGTVVTTAYNQANSAVNGVVTVGTVLTTAPVTWAANQTQNQGRLYERDGVLYRRIATGSTGSTFDASQYARQTPTIGTTAGTVAAGNDARLNDARTPTAHTHAISEVSGLQAAIDGKQASGTYATLVSGLVPSSQLPSYVDDVLEFASLASLPATGESGKIYVTVDTAKIYRWSGSAYVEISPSPGSTDSVTEGSTNLYYTNTRAAAAAPVQSVAGRTGAVTLAKGDVGLGNVDNTSDASKPISTATQTALDGKVSTSDSRLSDSREWSAATASQADAEAGTSTSRFAFTPVRVFQAIAAWWAASSAKTKLDGIATGATANSSDATLLARANHTGTQAWSTITSTPTTLSGYGITDAVGSSDARLTDARTPTSHVHGNITNAGAIGSTSGQIVVTTTSGVLTTAASISNSQVSGLGTLATQSGTFSGTSSGTNTGDQTITLTGDVTGSGTGSFAATLSSTGVSAGTFTSVTVDAKGRVTAGSSPAVAYSSLSGTPSTFAPAAHNQAWSTITSTPTTLSGYGITDAAAASHIHSAEDLTSGTVAAARLGSGTASASNFLRGDGAWTAAPVTSVDGSTGAVTVTKAIIYEFSRSSKPSEATGAVPGPYTWSVPSGAKFIEVLMVGGGGGGGSGRRGPGGTTRAGGAGGASGGVVQTTVSASLITTALTITIGTGGAGGAAATADGTNGNAGGNGGSTTITFNSQSGAVFTALFGIGGAGGTQATSVAGGSHVSNANVTWRGISGRNSNTGQNGDSIPSAIAATGNVAFPGAQGGSLDGASVIRTPGNVERPSTLLLNSSQFGSVISGGAATTSGAATAGDSAVQFGGGGCGGGASADVVSWNGGNSGAGGNGGDGYVRITVWF